MKKLLTLFFSVFIFFNLNAQTLPATYIQTTVVTGLQHPADFDFLPDGRYIVTQKGDNTFPASNAFIKIFKADGSLIGTFYDLTDSVDSDTERGLLGIAVDPKFTTNHYIYAYYLYRNAAQNILAMRVNRFTEVSNVGTNPKVIFNQVYATSKNTYSGVHVGGIIRFRPSQPDKLYIQIGELGYNQGNATLNYANKLNYPYGKILRINTDGTIPTDNPYYDDGKPATGNDDRIWSYGHRNMFGMCFSPVTDTMYSSENGWDTWDEFNVIHKGGNYGWATCEGEYINGSTNTKCTIASSVKPITTWPAPLPSVTGCLYYSGSVLSEFDNHLIVADNDYGILYDLTLGNAPAYDVVTNKKIVADIVSGTGGTGLTTIRQGSDGCIYALRGGYATKGEIYKICHKSVGVNERNEAVNEIGQNYPNPASGITQIDYHVTQAARVKIELMDITGKTIRVLADMDVSAGKHTVEVNDLSALSNGVYFYRMNVEQNNKHSFSQTKRMVVVN